MAYPKMDSHAQPKGGKAINDGYTPHKEGSYKAAGANVKESHLEKRESYKVARGMKKY